MENFEQRLQHQIDAEMKFQKDADLLNQRAVDKFSSSRSQTSTECLPPQSEAAANASG